MQGKNISDIIEQYLKSILAENNQIEIKRAQIAEKFDCVPSQINYVIKTRFSQQAGYAVESKRGGGGYVRIEKIQLQENCELLDLLLKNSISQLTERQAEIIIQTLAENELITEQELCLILTMLSHQTLNDLDKQQEELVRAKLVNSILNRLKYKKC